MSITPDCIERKIFSNLLSYLGELFQIREKTSTNNPQLSTSIDLYFRAISLYPYEGKYFMLLSNCSKIKDDLFGAIYWGIRSFACLNFYPMKETILKFLEDSRMAYLAMLEKDWMEVKGTEIFKQFILSFLRFLNIILTKIGFEEISTVASNMFEYLEKYIHFLLNEGKNTDTTNEISLFQQVVALITFALYNSIQGYNPKEEDHSKYLNPPEKKFAELANEDQAKECLKYSYAILYHIIELVISNLNENTINILVPFFYYAAEHRSVVDYLTNTYKNFKEKLVTFNEKLKESSKTMIERSQTTKEDILKILDECSFNNDKLLLGYIPIMLYAHKRKLFEKKPMDDNTQYLNRIVLFETILDNLGCNNQKDQKQNALFDLRELDQEEINEEAKKHINAFGFGFNSENKEKNLIVLDGQNVAIRYGDTRFSSLGIKLAIDYFKNKGHEVHVILPDYCYNKEEVALKRQLAISKDEGLKHIPDDVDLLIDLKSKGFAFGVPNWNYDDSFIIDYAKKKNAYIVTNDRYNDHIEKYSKNDQGKKKKLKDWVRSNCISFTFIGKEFIPDPDFLNTYMK